MRLLGYAVCAVPAVFASLFICASANAQQLQPPPAAPVPGYSPYAQPTYAPQTQYPTSGYPGAAPAPGSTVAQLNQSEQADSGRNLELAYARAEVGASYAALHAFSSSGIATTGKSEIGPMFGLAAGARFLIFTVGARARLNAYSDFDLWQLDLDLGYHIPIGKLDPYISIHGGYDFKSGGSNGYESLSLHGADVGASGGVDYYFSSLFSLGIDGTAEALILHDSIPASQAVDVSGNSLGFAASLSLHAGFHLGL